MGSTRRFGPEFVSAHQAKYGHRRRSDRQLTYDIAVAEEFEPWRRWLDDQVALLPPQDADLFERKLWLDEHHWPSIFELAAGAALRDEGYNVVYEQEFEGLTPDWTVLNGDGSPAMFVEVHTDQPARETFGRIRGWHVLDQHIAKIPVGVVVALVDRRNVPQRPPDGQTAKKIAEVLRSRLLSSAWTNSVEAHGYRFVVLGDRFGGPMKSPNAPYATFASPSGIAGAVDASRLARAVENKVRKYRAIADHYDVPLVVAAGAHRFTGLDLDDVDRLLAGEPTVTFQFNLGDTFIGKHQFNPAHPARWSMPADLSGLLWLHNQPPFSATGRPNADALRPLPLPTASNLRLTASAPNDATNLPAPPPETRSTARGSTPTGPERGVARSGPVVA